MAAQSQTATAAQARVRRITRPRELMPAERPLRMPTAAQAPPRRTTQGPGLLPRLCRDRMPMEATGPRRFRKTAIQHTASTKRPLRERQVKCTPQMGARRMARRVSMAIALRLVRPPTVTSTRPRTGTPIRTPEAGGVEIQTIPRNTVQLRAVLPLPRVGAGRKRAAGRQPLAAPAVEVGTPARPVLVVPRAWAGAAGGADEVVEAEASAGKGTQISTNALDRESHREMFNRHHIGGSLCAPAPKDLHS